MGVKRYRKIVPVGVTTDSFLEEFEGVPKVRLTTGDGYVIVDVDADEDNVLLLDYQGSNNLFVDDMPDALPGWKQTNRWIEAEFDGDGLYAIRKWRQDSAFADCPSDQLPDPHMTVLFGYCPAAELSIQRLIAAMPRQPWYFSRVAALGPPGKENVWAAVTDDPAVVAWLAAARNDPALNCGHASYVETGGWGARGDDFSTIVPHATLVRGVKDLDPAAPPALGALAGSKMYFVGLVEWVGLEKDGHKIKLCRRHYPGVPALPQRQ